MTEKRIFISQDTFLAFPTEKSMKILILINDPNQIFSFFNISKSAQSNCYDTNHWQIPGNIFFMLNQAKVSGYILLKYQVTQKMLLSEVITFFGTPCTLYHMYVCYTLYLLFFPHDFLFCNFFSALLKQEKKSKLVLDENKTESAKILIFRFQIQTDRLDLIAVDLEDFCID